MEGCTCIVTGPTRCALSSCVEAPSVQHLFQEYIVVSMRCQELIFCCNMQRDWQRDRINACQEECPW